MPPSVKIDQPVTKLTLSIAFLTDLDNEKFYLRRKLWGRILYRKYLNLIL